MLPQVTKCSVDGCIRGRRSAVGYCLMHYKRWRRHGDPLVTIRVRSLSLDRRSAKIDRSGECHVWTGATDEDGYGVIKNNGKRWRVHRLAYEQWVGPVPPEMCVLHRCDNPPCVNPAHLWVGTSAENTEDKMQKGRWAGGRPRGRPARKGVASSSPK